MSELYVYLIRSRNKDNKDIPNFKERAKTIIEYKKNEDKIYEEFKRFAEQGLPNEKTRLYRSVNSRDEDKCRESLIIRLLKDKPSMTKLNSVIASVCQSCENRAESKWLFDFDYKDINIANDFCSDIESLDIKTELHETVNGYAIITEHGFDTREILNKYRDYDITLKKDELLFLDIITKG